MSDYKPQFTWTIYELDPSATEEGDEYRMVQMFDREEDALKVLEVLESVNDLFHCYKIVKMVIQY